jgi:MFS family permease
MVNRDTFKDYLFETPNFLAIFLLPIFILTTSPILIEIANSLGVSPEDLNIIFTFFNIGIVTGQLTSVFYNIKFKRIHIILFSYSFLIVISMLLFFSKTLSLFFILYLLGGYLLGVTYVQASENILECKVKNKDRILTVAFSFFPIGAIIAPVISSQLVKNNISWRFVYIIIMLIIFFVMFLLIFLTRKNKYASTYNKREKIVLKEIFADQSKNIYFVTVFIVLVIYCVSESVVAAWAPTFFRLSKNMPLQSAAITVSFFQLFIIAGRMSISFFAGKIKAEKIMILLTIFSTLSILLIIFSNTELHVFLSISFAGIGFSGMYPLLISSGSTIYEKGRGFLASLLFAAAYLGKSVTPFIIRAIARYDLVLSFSFSAILTAVLVFLVLFLFFFKKKINRS